MAQFFVPTDDNKIVAITKLLFDAAPGATYLSQFKQIAATSSIASLGDWLVSVAGTSNAAVAAQIASSLKLTGQKAVDAAAYAEAKLDAYGAARGQAMLDLVAEIVALQNDPFWGADVNVFIASVNRSYVYSTNGANSTTDLSVLVNADEEPDDTVIDLSLALTAGTDNLVGTAANDAFTAFLSQNATAGGVSNTLSSADRLNGGAGDDSLYAEVVTEFVGSASGEDADTIDIQPRTTNIEEIEFEVRDISAADAGFGVVSIDAKHMYGVERIGSTKSDGDLVIENLTTLANDGVTKRDTSSLTITMDHTDNFNTDKDASDLHVYLDDNYLIAGQNTEISLELRIVNAYELAENGAPLTGFESIQFTAGTTVLNVDISSATSYAEVVALLNAALGTAGISGVTATPLPERDARFTDDIGGYNGGDIAGTYTPILLSSNGVPLTKGPVTFDSINNDFNGLNTWITPQDVVTDEPVSINIELTKVGRGDDGGELIIGAKSQHQGIPVFNVTVLGGEELPNSLQALGTTGEDLEEVYITSDSNGSTTYASLEIRGADQEAFNQNSLSLVNANAFLGDLTLGSGNAVDNLYTLTATGGGDIAFYGELTGPGGVFSYTTGAGADTVVLDIDGDSVDTVGDSLAINTGAGDDEVIVSLYQDVSQETMYLLDNMSINTGAGDDYINVNGIANFNVVAGAGSDFVEIEANDQAEDWGSWTFGDPTGVQDFAARVLFQADLTVTFAGFEQTVRVNTTAANNFVATQLDINAAIIAAIAANPELARLLTVTKGTGLQDITVRSTVDGENALSISLYQPEVVASSPTLGQVQLSVAAQWEAVAQGLIQTGVATTSADVEDAGLTRDLLNTIDGSLDQTGAVDGTLGDYDYLDSDNGGSDNGMGAVNWSQINMGDGSNDLLVVDSNDASVNTLIIDQTFGKVSVVNFFTAVLNNGGTPDGVIGDEVGTVGEHALDFTAYLTNTIDPSDNPPNDWSVVPVAVQLSGDTLGATEATANSVTLLSYDESLVGSITFDALTVGQLVTALNTVPVTVTGGLTDADLDVIATTDLVGTTQHHIVMVENALNLGEYKVFHLSSNNVADAAFTAGTGGLLGTIDFGASLDGFEEVNLVGSADFDAVVAAFLNP